MSDATQEFAQILRDAGLRGDWERTCDGSYNLGTAWWQSFFVTEMHEGEWIVIEYDYDAGVDDAGNSTTSSEAWASPGAHYRNQKAASCRRSVVWQNLYGFFRQVKADEYPARRRIVAALRIDHS